MANVGGFVSPSAPYNTGGYSGAGAKKSLPTSTVEVSVSCSKLKDKDVTSRSDPVCVLSQKSKGTGKWNETGRTECIKDTMDPKFATKFILDYSFEERQQLRFEVYDWDVKTGTLQQQDFLGVAEVTLGQIVASKQGFTSDLTGGGKGKIHLTAEELGASKEIVTFQLKAKKLDNKDFMGKSDPFFVLSKESSNGFVVVHRSNVVENDLSPKWAAAKLPIRDICNNDPKRRLKIEVFDHDDGGKHDLIGACTTDLASLESASRNKHHFDLINEKKRAKKKGYKNSGEIIVKAFKKETEITFLDYVQGGTAMNFSVAVDFTASNGDPRDSRSLHYFDPVRGENQYTAAIRSVGEIIEDYDSDRLFPALGFGAKLPPYHQVSHEFFLNLRQDNPYCAGVPGLLQAYHTSLQHVALHGPTYFTPIIRHVMRIAQQSQDGRQYFVLLIITDGIITDMQETVAALVEASGLPMSVIIVGVGNEDFRAMEALDGDGGLLRARGRVAARDIVQFVELRKYMDRRTGGWDKDLLAKEVLAEVPKQLVKWMQTRGLKPLNWGESSAPSYPSNTQYAENPSSSPFQSPNAPYPPSSAPYPPSNAPYPSSNAPYPPSNSPYPPNP